MIEPAVTMTMANRFAAGMPIPCRVTVIWPRRPLECDFEPAARPQNHDHGSANGRSADVRLVSSDDRWDASPWVRPIGLRTLRTAGGEKQHAQASDHNADRADEPTGVPRPSRITHVCVHRTDE